MKSTILSAVAATFVAGALGISLIGCGGGESTKKDNEFFTSGDREADQRADQRMAKDQQLKDAKAPGAAAANADVKRSLYDRLGSDAGISAIVDDFLPRALADPRVNWARKGVKQGGFSIHRGRSVEWEASAENIEKLKLHLKQFVALATGGPSKYEGKEMKPVHAYMHISNPEFDAAVGDLKASLDKLQVPVKEQKELLAIVESTRPEIVEER